MTTYVPPHSRNKTTNGIRKPLWKIEEEKKEDERLSKLIQSDSNFPSLSSAEPKPRPAWGGQKSFASLANDWKEKSDADKEADEREQLRRVRMACNTATPRFYHMQPIENYAYENEEVEYKPQEAHNSEEDWNVISKKARPAPKEITHEQLEREYAEIHRVEEGGSMWNDEPRDHETYWDERRI